MLAWQVGTLVIKYRVAKLGFLSTERPVDRTQGRREEIIKFELLIVYFLPTPSSLLDELCADLRSRYSPALAPYANANTVEKMMKMMMIHSVIPKKHTYGRQLSYELCLIRTRIRVVSTH